MQNQNLRLDRSPFYCEENVEVRSLDGAGMNDSGRLVVRGYAALFNTRSREMKSFKGRRFVEEIAPGAFDGADFKDTECRFQHTRFLAAPPTLRMGVDARGLWYEYDHDPEDPDHVSVLRKIQRGDAKGSSFMFDEPEDTDQEVWREGSLMVRRIKTLRKIWDVGPVVRPAYRETGVTASMRSIDAVADMEELPEPDGSPVEVGGTPVEQSGSPVEQSGTAAESGGTPVEQSGTSMESGGSSVEVGGTTVEQSGTLEESGGSPVEAARSADGSPAEAGRTEVEAERIDAEKRAIIERRRLQVRATLI